MTGLETLIIPALIPIVTDTVKSIVAKFTGGAGAKPQTVDEEIKLMGAKIDYLKAMSELDKASGLAARWVYSLRESFRYIAASAIILNAIVAGALYYAFTAVSFDYVELSWAYAGSAFAFIFGDRVLINLKRK